MGFAPHNPSYTTTGQPASPPPHEWHLVRHHGHEQHVRGKRQVRHVDDGVADVLGLHAGLLHHAAVGLHHAGALHHAVGERGGGIADVDLAAADVERAAVEG